MIKADHTDFKYSAQSAKSAGEKINTEFYASKYQRKSALDNF